MGGDSAPVHGGENFAVKFEYWFWADRYIVSFKFKNNLHYTYSEQKSVQIYLRTYMVTIKLRSKIFVLTLKSVKNKN